MYNIITVEREYGAGGSAVAARLAKHLGWEVLDQAITDEIARIGRVDRSAVASCDEHVDPPLYRLARVFWRGSFERIMPALDDTTFDTDRMVELARQVIEKAGDKGKCVIVGRGAPYFLRERKDAFHVFLFAPREVKIRRTVKEGVSQKEAEELVDTVDQERAAFIKRYFGKEWPYRYLYNIMLNTAVGLDATVETILNAMEISKRVPAVR